MELKAARNEQLCWNIWEESKNFVFLLNVNLRRSGVLIVTSECIEHNILHENQCFFILQRGISICLLEAVIY